MASYRKRGKTWTVEVNRKGVREVSTHKSKALAEEWARTREADLLGRRYTGKFTLREAFTRYSEEISPTKRGKRWEQIRLLAFARSMRFVDMALGDITPDQLGQWRDDRLKVVKSSSVRRELILLTSVLEAARVEWRWIGANPARDVRKPANQPARDRLISNPERDAILKELGSSDETPETYAQEVAIAFRLALETAMRAGELMALKWPNIHKNYVRLPATKNGTVRDVPLSTEARRLIDLMEVRKDDPRVFTIKGPSLDAIFRKARDRTQYGDITFHDTRHTAITRLAKKLPLLDLARMTGHRDLRSLQVYYNAKAADIAELLG